MDTGSTPPPPGGWPDAPLLAAVTAHRDAGHPGQALACQDPECRARVDAALAAAFEDLPAGRPGRLLT